MTREEERKQQYLLTAQICLIIYFNLIRFYFRCVETSKEAFIYYGHEIQGGR